MNIRTLASVAVSEARTCTRLVRTWMFIGLAGIIGFATYTIFCLGHFLGSTESTVATGATAPRFLTVFLGGQLIGLFVIGLVFLAFDVRSRDVRERISDVLDTQPVSNLELVTGRLIGIILVLGIPALCFVTLALLHGIFAGLFGWGFGAPIEFTSLLAFIVWDIVPNLAFWGAFVIFLATLIRFRLLVVVVSLTVFGIWIWLGFRFPFEVMSPLNLNFGSVVFPSDIAPVFVTTATFFNRVAFTLMTIGLLCVAASLLQRTMSARMGHAISGVGTIVVGALVIAGLFGAQVDKKAQIERWTTAQMNVSTRSYPDVEHMSGSIDIRPSRFIELDLSLDVTLPSTHSSDQVTFSLNPGYKIEALAIDGQDQSKFEFNNGILVIEREAFGGELTTLEIKARGIPNASFAYLNPAIKTSEISAIGADQLLFLGLENYIFHPNFVALVPGITWYPISGAAVHRDNLDHHPTDFFTVDLEISVPKHWMIAGPGDRQHLETSNRTKYVIRPQNPIPQIALLASKFERASMEIHGIDFEVLYNRKHSRTFDALAEMMPKVREWATEKLDELQAVGIEYPYSILSFVEVPTRLRIYGGGWRMDTNLHAPGIVMLRESALPTARFDVAFHPQRREGAEIEESDVDTWMFQHVQRYFSDDLHGNDPMIGITRNFVKYQTEPKGAGATALGFAMELLMTSLISDRKTYFSTEQALDPFLVGAVQGGNFSTGIPFGTARHNFNTLSSVWENVEDVAPSDFDYYREPVLSFKACYLKSNGVVDSLEAVVDREVLFKVLGDLISEFRGRSFSYGDLVRISDAHGQNFDQIVSNWIAGTELPGFIIDSTPIVRKMMDPDDGSVFYQTTLSIRNEELVPGVVQIGWSADEEPQSFSFLGINEEPTREYGQKLLMKGQTSYELSYRSPVPLKQINLKMPLSLNRDSTHTVRVPQITDLDFSDESALPQIGQNSWIPEVTGSITVDDLDDGFSIINQEETSSPTTPWYMAFIPIPSLSVQDRGLPLSSFSSGIWSREHRPFQSFGRYRHTIATTWSGNGDKSASFSAVLPKSSQWALDYYIPDLVDPTSVTVPLRLVEWEARQRGEFSQRLDEEAEGARSWLGSIQLTIETPSQSVEELVPARELSPGWYRVGSYSLESGDVTVLVSDKSVRGVRVFADAIRWTPIEAQD